MIPVERVLRLVPDLEVRTIASSSHRNEIFLMLMGCRSVPVIETGRVIALDQ